MYCNPQNGILRKGTTLKPTPQGPSKQVSKFREKRLMLGTSVRI